jgi:hypothetical protein
MVDATEGNLLRLLLLLLEPHNAPVSNADQPNTPMCAKPQKRCNTHSAHGCMLLSVCCLAHMLNVHGT